MEKDSKRKAKRTVYNVIDTSYTPDYEDYVDYCKANSIEPEGEDSDGYWDYASDMRQVNYNCDIESLKCCQDYDHKCIITGSLGLWDGQHDIHPCVCKDIVSAIKKCYGSCDDIEVKFEDGVYYCYAHHHDGCNTFAIRKLSKKGLEATSKWRGNTKEVEVRPWWTSKFKGLWA